MPHARPCARHHLHSISFNSPDSLEELGFQHLVLTITPCRLLCRSTRRIMYSMLLREHRKGPCIFLGCREAEQG